MMTTNIVFGGIGGQGIVTASDIFADAAFSAGFDVKKSDVHGMAQRGGSVSSDVRFGARVFSPMIPAHEADILVIFDEARIDDFTHRAKPHAQILSPSVLAVQSFENKRLVNVAMLALLTRYVPVAPAHFEEAIRKNLKPGVHELSIRTYRQSLESLDERRVARSTHVPTVVHAESS